MRSRTLDLLLLLLLALSLTACGPLRSGNNNGDDDDTTAADDDDATEPDPGEPGLFAYQFSDYYDGYYIAYLSLPLESGFGCSDLGEGGYFYDSDYNYVGLYLYRGSDRSWEGSYDSDCDLYDYDYANLHCFGGAAYDNGNESYVDSGDSLEIETYSDSQVVGEASIGGETYRFTVVNCGEYTYDGRSENSSDSTTPVAPAATVNRAYKAARKGSWGLRFR